MRILVLTAAFLTIGAAANATVSQDALKVCTERYNTEKDGGTIPVGMSKSRYMSQCMGSMRRAAKLEQDLAAGTATDTAGGNEVATSTTTTRPAATTTKPARVKTTLSLGPRGT